MMEDWEGASLTALGLLLSILAMVQTLQSVFVSLGY